MSSLGYLREWLAGFRGKEPRFSRDVLPISLGGLRCAGDGFTRNLLFFRFLNFLRNLSHASWSATAATLCFPLPFLGFGGIGEVALQAAK